MSNYMSNIKIGDLTFIIKDNEARGFIENLQSQINGLASGSPLVASSTSGMTDTTKVYVNTTDGKWYYHNGTLWVSGGTYQATGIEDGSIDNLKTNSTISYNIDYDKLAISKGYKRFLMNDYEIGTILHTNGTNQPYASALRSKTMHKFSKNIRVINNNPTKYRYRTYGYDESGNFESVGSWRSESHTFEIDPTKQFRIVIEHVGGTSIDVQDVLDTIYTVYEDEKINSIEELEELTKGSLLDYTKTAMSYGFNKFFEYLSKSTNWESGSITYNNGNNLESTEAIRTKTPVTFEHNITFKNLLNSKYRLRYITYNLDGTHKSYSDWITKETGEITIASDVLYRFIIYSPNVNIEEIKEPFEFVKFFNSNESMEKENDLYSEEVEAINHSRWTQNQNTPLSLIHFADIHAITEQLQRIVKFKEKNSNLIQDIVCVGDMVSGYYGNGFGFWDNVEGSENILIVPGNHDYYQNPGDSDTLVNTDLVANTYIDPYVANWNVSHTTGTTWWYKDYAESKVRLIGLDCMLRNTEFATNQLAFLNSALEGAKTNGYTVIIAVHTPPAEHNLEFIDCSFTDKTSGYLTYETTPNTIITAVQSFIDNGGSFACYLFGHMHSDYFVKLKNFPDQVGIIIGKTLNVLSNHGDVNRVSDTKSQDLFNVLTVDTERKLIKLIRVGANRSLDMRSRKTLCYNYSTHTLISND